MGALEWVLGKVQHDDLLLDLEPYLGVRDALPVLLRILLGLSFGLDLWGAIGAAVAPVLAWECLALIASDTLAEAS